MKEKSYLGDPARLNGLDDLCLVPYVTFRSYLEITVHGLNLPTTSKREDRNCKTPNTSVWVKLYITADCKNTEWFNESHNKFPKPTNPNSLNTKSPYVFEYGHSMKSAKTLLGREAHPKWKAQSALLTKEKRHLPLTIHLLSVSHLFCQLGDHFSFLFIFPASAGSAFHCNTSCPPTCPAFGTKQQVST